MDTEHIDTALSDLQASKDAWASLDIQTKLEMLGELRTKAGAHARRWVEAAAKAKGLSMDTPLAGEEWIAGPFAFIDAINATETTLVRIASDADVLDGVNVHKRPDGQVILDVLPFAASDKLLFSGSSAQVWMQPDVTVESLRDKIGTFYRKESPSGSVCLILGAGNVASIPPLDVLNKLFNEGSVVMLKMNPVNEYLGEIFEDVFEGFVDAGYLRFVYGGGDVGTYLTAHQSVDAIHITGSADTYNTIRYGSGQEGKTNRGADTPTNTKPISAELGGVSPTIVVPGDWSRADLRFQAENIVTQKMNNSGFNCVATQILILPESWDLADALLDEIRALLGRIGDRDAYYPGTTDRCEAVEAGSGEVETFGDETKRFLVTGLDAGSTDDAAFTTEYFAPALSVVALPSPDVPSYVAAATSFANEVLVGTLGASIVVHPKTEKRFPAAIDQMIAGLRYGGIGVNTWSASVYLLSRCPWGAFPGNVPSDIGSGVGVVHNTLMLDDAQKAVARGPFAPSHRTLTKGEIHMAPKPVFFITNKQMHNVGERLVDYAMSGKTTDMMKVVSSAIRG
ncbi:MAG: aldehyde dehydrogenase family protein [Acidimicrobiia bacterium]|nr:MAG: aldehyde dehydrogenase family protein [Acidimicrobiia bacterium]